MPEPLSRDFYEIQRLQWKKSLVLFFILIIFYFLATGLISAVFLFSVGLFFPGVLIPLKSSLLKILFLNSAISVIIASLHFYDARKLGPSFILKRMRAQPPDFSDRYHKQFADTVEEIKIASGLPEATSRIIPSFAVNSMALISPDKIPLVLVTEGLLAEFTREELQAVVAHELSHIIRGDTFYLTLVCSLTNFIERIRLALEPEKHPKRYGYQAEGGGPLLAYLAATLSSIAMHLISTLISREREILADASAVELCRNPKALARAIYKAHLKNSFVGDFSLGYSPLFIVPPESRGEGNGLFQRVFNSHPPLMKRIKLLADMVK